jgi:hypothetical protein
MRNHSFLRVSGSAKFIFFVILLLSCVDGLSNNLAYGKLNFGFFEKSLQSFVTGGTSAFVGGYAQYQYSGYDDEELYTAVKSDRYSYIYNAYKNLACDFGQNNVNLTDKNNLLYIPGDIVVAIVSSSIANSYIPTGGNFNFGNSIGNSLLGNGISSYVSGIIENNRKSVADKIINISFFPAISTIIVMIKKFSYDIGKRIFFTVFLFK